MHRATIMGMERAGRGGGGDGPADCDRNGRRERGREVGGGKQTD